MLGSLSDDVRYDGSDLVRIIESDAPQSQIKFDCILALQGIAGCFGMIQEIPDQFDILVGNPFAAVLTFGTSFVHRFHDGLAQSFL